MKAEPPRDESIRGECLEGFEVFVAGAMGIENC
jgi:hypothetical protein